MLTQTNGNYHAVAELLDQGDTRHVRRYGLSAIPVVLNGGRRVRARDRASATRTAVDRRLRDAQAAARW